MGTEISISYNCHVLPNYYPFDLFQLFSTILNDLKSILNSQAVQNQMADWTWQAGFIKLCSRL